MRGVRERVGERFAHPLLTLSILVGASVGIAGVGLWVAGPGTLAGLGLRAAILGYVVALFGVSGYVSITAFERRDRRLE